MKRSEERSGHPFVPRVVNPIKVERVVIFAGERRIREAVEILSSEMPWVDIEVVHDPISATRMAGEGPTVFLFDDTALPLVDSTAIRGANPSAVLVLLTGSPYIQCAPPRPALERYPYTGEADLILAYDNDECLPRLIVVPAVRAAEDLINIRARSDTRRFIFLVIDDEPRWLSLFLPVLYDIIGQRASVMVTRTYEEALQFLFAAEEEAAIDPEEMRTGGHARDVVFLITDIFFPRGDEQESEAGRDIIRLVEQFYPRIPIVIASKAEEAEAFRNRAFILPKGDPGSLLELEQYIRDFSGMGDFLVLDPDGSTRERIKDIYGIHRMVRKAKGEGPEAQELRSIIEGYAEKDRFSTWLYMHSYRELANLLRPRHTRGRELIALLEQNLAEEIEQLVRTPLIMNGRRVHTIAELLDVLRTAEEEVIQPFSDNDVFSSWLDHQGFSELAEELRPIHGSGDALRGTLISVIEKWAEIYAARDDGERQMH